MKAKTLYDELIIQKIPKRQKSESKHSETFNENFDQNVWENIYLMPRICVYNNKIKDLQYQILHCFVPTDRLLYQMKKVESDKCGFCFLQKETIYHVFFECIKLRSVWIYVEQLCSDLCNEHIHLTCKDVILGYRFDDRSIQTTIMVNKIVQYCKYYIWKSKRSDCEPNIHGFRVALEQHRIFDTALTNV